MKPCRFDDGMVAAARFSTPEGCACYPDDREQDLCGQHIIKNGMQGDYSLLEVYRPDVMALIGWSPSAEPKAP